MSTSFKNTQSFKISRIFSLVALLALLTGVSSQLHAQQLVTISFTSLSNQVDNVTQTVEGLNFTIRSWIGNFDSNADGISIDSGTINVAFNSSAVKIMGFTLTQNMLDDLQGDENITFQNFANSDDTRQTFANNVLSAGTTNLSNQFLVSRSPNDVLAILAENSAGAALRLQSIQVQIVPEPATTALLLALITLSAVIIRRKCRS